MKFLLPAIFLLHVSTTFARQPGPWKMENNSGFLCRNWIEEDDTWGQECQSVSDKRSVGTIFVAVVTTAAGIATIAGYVYTTYSWITSKEDQDTCIANVPASSPDGAYQGCLTKSSQETNCEPQLTDDEINNGLSQAINYVSDKGLSAACLALNYNDGGNEVLMIKLIHGSADACSQTCGSYAQIN